MDEKRARELLDDCENVASVSQDNGGPGFSQWELEFLESISEWLDAGRSLTDPQAEKLQQIWNKI